MFPPLYDTFPDKIGYLFLPVHTSKQPHLTPTQKQVNNSLSFTMLNPAMLQQVHMNLMPALT